MYLSMVASPRDFESRYPHIRFRRHWDLETKVYFQLGECAAIVAAMCELPLPPDRYGELLGVSLKKGAQATTAIEGNTLTDDEVATVAAGGALPPSKEYQEREVRNILQAMNVIFQNLTLQVVPQDRLDLRVSKKLLLEMHEGVGRGLGEHFDAIPGRLRTDERVVGPYRCPRAEDVPRLVDRFCEWLEDEMSWGDRTFATAVIKAIVAHVYLEWIHPFGDGNGRTGRLLEFYLLLRAGNPDIASHILSNFYNLTRPEYYRQIERACKTSDLSAFISYAVEGYRDGLLESLRTIQNSVFETSWRALIYDRFAVVPYTKKNVFKRRRNLMLSLPLGREVSLAEWVQRDAEVARAYARLTTRTLVRDVNALMAMELASHGSTTLSFRARTDLLRQLLPRRAADSRARGSHSTNTSPPVP